MHASRDALLASEQRQGYIVAMARDARVFVFDHISVGVENLERAAVFYDACLAPLGYVQLWRSARAVGYGPQGYTAEAPFAIVTSGPDVTAPGRGFHLAFVAPSREAVDRFHAEALGQGGVDEGPPGIRENYDPGYYAAFVRDLDGHRLEAVLHEQ
jgi:catechol 2,3-dioxygenase-like lactoylglutathione lyase family enzyme